MDYQTLTDLLGQNNSVGGQAPSLNSIIEGIQSQYEPVQLTQNQSGLYGANRYISGSPQFGAIEKMPEFGEIYQAAGPSFVPSQFNLEDYQKADPQILSNLIAELGYGSGFDGGNGLSGQPSGTPGFTIGPDGFAIANTVSPTLGQVMGMIAGNAIGIPGLSFAGKALANQANFANAQNAMGFNVAVSDTTNPANINFGSLAATMGEQGTGGTAAAAGAAAAAAAAAAGHSDAAIGAAAQAAADAAISGNAANAAAIGAVAAAAADSADGSVSIGADGGISSSSAEGTAEGNSGIGGW